MGWVIDGGGDFAAAVDPQTVSMWRALRGQRWELQPRPAALRKNKYAALLVSGLFWIVVLYSFSANIVDTQLFKSAEPLKEQEAPEPKMASKKHPVENKWSKLTLCLSTVASLLHRVVFFD